MDKNLPFHNQSVWIEKKDEGFWIRFKTKQGGEAVCYLHVPAKYHTLIEKPCGKTTLFSDRWS